MTTEASPITTKTATPCFIATTSRYVRHIEERNDKVKTDHEMLREAEAEVVTRSKQDMEAAKQVMNKGVRLSNVADRRPEDECEVR